MQFPTGGKVRDLRKQPNRCDSSTNSTVWMEEEFMFFKVFAPGNPGAFAFLGQDLFEDLKNGERGIVFCGTFSAERRGFSK